MSLRLPSARTGPVRSKAMEILRTAIFSGRFKPGNALREIQLARDLGVSQATVRDCLVELEHLGLVIRVPNKETRVTQLSSHELRERIKLRLVLENLACVEASEKMVEEDYRQLNRLCGKIQHEVDANSLIDLMRADLEFHTFVWEKSGLTIVPKLLKQVTAPLFAFITLVRLQNLAPAQVAGHEHIVAALRSRRKTLIGEVIESYVVHSYNQFLNTEFETFDALSSKVVQS
jgi:DNA-binding GntR family transcriptional regulator